MLKKLFYIFCSLSILVVIASCSKDDEKTENFNTEESLKIIAITDVVQATANVRVVFSESLDLIETGICWSEGMNPRAQENLTVYGDSNGQEQTLKLFGTSPGKQYFVRAFAKTPNGILYSENTSFTTTSLCSAGATNQDFSLSSQTDVTELGNLGLCSLNNLFITTKNPNDPIVDLTPLSGIKQINVLIISSNDMLASLNGLETIENVQHMGIYDNSALTNLVGLHGISGVIHGLNILSNSQLVSVEGLENISLIVPEAQYDGKLNIGGNDNLETLEGLEGLKEILGSIDIKGNPKLRSLKGLDSFRKFDGGDIFIENNDALENLNGLENLEVIKGNFYLIDLPTLNSIEALSNLTTANYLYLRYLNSLTKLDGIENIQVTSTDEIQFYLWENENLTDISAFSSYTSIGALSIIDTPITDFSPLSNVTDINYNLSLRNVNTSSLAGLSNLESVGRIFFDGLNNLENLTGLEKLRNVGMFGNSSQNGDIAIYACTNLTNFCALEGLLTMGTIDGNFSASDNAYNPTQQDILDGNCSQ